LGNKISDINVIEKVNFKELEKLLLNDNKISDIKVLDKVTFNKLKVLTLGNDEIYDFENILINYVMKSKIRYFYK